MHLIARLLFLWTIIKILLNQLNFVVLKECIEMQGCYYYDIIIKINTFKSAVFCWECIEMQGCYYYDIIIRKILLNQQYFVVFNKYYFTSQFPRIWKSTHFINNSTIKLHGFTFAGGG
jgi:hypothetical protein